MPTFGGDGVIVCIGHKKNAAFVSMGLGKWEMPLDEVFPVETE